MNQQDERFELRGLSHLARLGLPWDPWVGCAKVDTGCKRCVVFSLVEDASWIRKTDDDQDDPSTTAQPTLFFVCPRSDFFIEEADGWRDQAWEAMRSNPQHTFLVLSRRPQLMASRLPQDWPLQNVWLGVGVEDQRTADRRIPILMGLPAAIRFAFLEPLLGPVDLGDWLPNHETTPGARCRCIDCRSFDPSAYDASQRGLDWIGAGCELGIGARPCDESWLLSVETQCRLASVPFHFNRMQRSDKLLLDGRAADGLPRGNWPFLSAARA